MTLPWYPPELPRPYRNGYQHSRGDGRTRISEDAGPPNVRARYSAVADAVAFTTLLTRAQLGRFDRFYDHEIRRGSLPFLMPDHGTDGWALLAADGRPLLAADGQPLLLAATWVCLIGKQTPSRVPVGNRWQVSFDIMVMP